MKTAELLEGLASMKQGKDELAKKFIGGWSSRFFDEMKKLADSMGIDVSIWRVLRGDDSDQAHPPSHAFKRIDGIKNVNFKLTAKDGRHISDCHRLFREYAELLMKLAPHEKWKYDTLDLNLRMNGYTRPGLKE